MTRSRGETCSRLIELAVIQLAADTIREMTVETTSTWNRTDDAYLLSVVLCTYNRAPKLPESLDSLRAQQASDQLRWELVCVDNNSNDDTRAVLEDFARASGIPMTYVFEPQQGLACARNTGLRHARGSIIAMTDDDCIAAPDWVASITSEFAADRELALLGGRVELHNPLDLPLSLRTGLERKAFSLDALFNLIPGCNIAFRREVVERVGPFDPDFGAGGPLISAEDCEFVYRVHRAGLKIVYVPDIVVRHDHGRRTDSDRQKLDSWYVTGRGSFYAKWISRGDLAAARLAYWETYALIKGSLPGAGDVQSRAKHRLFLRYLLRGALAFPKARLARLVGAR